MGRITLFFGFTLLGSACADIQPIDDQRVYGPVTTIKDWFTSVSVLPYSDGVVLFDAGFRKGAIEKGLERQGFTPDDVTHVFITHGHGDHIGALSLFPNAIRLGLAAEQAHIEEESDGAQTLDETLVDGTLMSFDRVQVETIALPGHTEGNAAYRVDNVVLLGDSALVTGDGRITPVAEKRSEDPAEAAASLAGLYIRLEKTVPAVDWLVPAHSGGIEGLDALQAFSDSHSP